MSEVKVTPKKCAKIWMEDAEVCREYYKTDKITFGMSELPVGGVGGIDPGHAEADAMLMPQGKDHRLFNIGDKKAILTWSCAPHQ